MQTALLIAALAKLLSQYVAPVAIRMFAEMFDDTGEPVDGAAFQKLIDDHTPTVEILTERQKQIARDAGYSL